jgi:hypothetical protein
VRSVPTLVQDVRATRINVGESAKLRLLGINNPVDRR